MKCILHNYGFHLICLSLIPSSAVLAVLNHYIIEAKDWFSYKNSTTGKAEETGLCNESCQAMFKDKSVKYVFEYEGLEGKRQSCSRIVYKAWVLLLRICFIFVFICGLFTFAYLTEAVNGVQELLPAPVSLGPPYYLAVYFGGANFMIAGILMAAGDVMETRREGILDAEEALLDQLLLSKAEKEGEPEEGIPEVPDVGSEFSKHSHPDIASSVHSRRSTKLSEITVV